MRPVEWFRAAMKLLPVKKQPERRAGHENLRQPGERWKVRL